MAYWQHAAEGTDQRLNELATLFAGCREAFFDILDEFHWQHTSESMAAFDLANSVDGPAGPWGELPVRVMMRVVADYLVIASSHLGGLATLHAGHEVLLSPPLLVRAIIENCARAIWVLAIDDMHTTQTRVARAHLEEFLSAEEAKTVSGRLGEKSSPTHTDAAAHYRELRDRILPALFEDVTRETLAAKQLGGQQLPRPEQCVIWMYEEVHKLGVGVTGRQGQGAYGLLSNMTHPTLYPLRQMTAWDQHAGTHAESYLALDVAFIDKLAGAAVVPFYNAVSLLLSYMGWKSERFSAWESQIDVALPGTFSH